MALHEQCVGATDEWYTPPYVFKALGCQFDLDVAHPGEPYADWIPAHRVITADSLREPWSGFVWMNPPFGGRNGVAPWLDKFMAHGNGIALAPDRTSAPWWQQYAPRAGAVLFVAPKIKFIGRDGLPGRSPAQGTVLLGRGPKACAVLARAEAAGLGQLFFPHVKDKF
jgi:hypothetical protein